MISGVLFDLYGTLVPPFRRREHTAAIGACAGILGMDAGACHEAWRASFPGRLRGEFATVADNFAWIARQAGRQVSAGALAAAHDCYLRFTAESLRPLPGAVELLRTLTGRGLRIGLVSNCAPDVPPAWPTSPLAEHFGFCAFSCQLGVAKPEPAIYRAALTALGLSPARTLYVGDGSDAELSGAATCGMRPVLVLADVSNTYDVVRADVESWTGDVVRDLRDLAAFG